MSPEGRHAALGARLLVAACLGVTLLASGCSTPEAVCLRARPVGLDKAAAIAADDSLPFRLPLDASGLDEEPYHAWFGDRNEAGDERRYHAAEDYHRPAGTPVYAVADGRVSFSGTAGGYGWLVIVDHPQLNLYSLYGHLSPSRWSHEPGPVSKGELLGYLGDPDENGGSREKPLEPHLHFGLRAGQRSDYPSRGEWRWMAGWIGLCPQDLGWLQPSFVITMGTVPAGGFAAPDPGFMVTWGLGIVLTVAYSAMGTGLFVLAVRKGHRLFLLFPGAILIVAGVVLHGNEMVRTYALLVVGVILTGVGIRRLRKLRPLSGKP